MHAFVPTVFISYPPNHVRMQSHGQSGTPRVSRSERKVPSGCLYTMFPATSRYTRAASAAIARAMSSRIRFALSSSYRAALLFASMRCRKVGSGVSESSSDSRGFRTEPVHQPSLFLCRGMPPALVVGAVVEYPHSSQVWRNVLTVGGSKNTQRVSALTAGGTVGDAVGFGSSAQQLRAVCPNLLQRKHRVGLGQSAAKCPHC